MQAWQEALKAALVGSAQHAPDWSGVEGPLGQLLQQLEPANRERALLQAAALLAPWRRAGRLPLRADGLSGVQDARDDQPRCPPEVAHYLTLFLQSYPQQMVVEWLTAVASRGWRAPEEYLPQLLALGRQQRDLRERIAPVLGARGRWLAGLNEDWRYAIERSDPAVWETGSLPERLALLAHLRRQDPRAGRELLRSTWESEPASARVELVELLEHGLGPDDETFLEAALDDKRKEVRRAAAELLARLPESRYCQRMLARLQPLLSVRKRLLLGFELEVLPPDSKDKGMVRDGLETSSPLPWLGEKAWWLAQMLGVTPPSFWSSSFGKTPSELIQAALKTEWKEALLVGWATATRRHADAGWLEALARLWIAESESYTTLSQDLMSTDVFSALNTLPPQRAEPLVIASLEREPSWWLVRLYSQPWSHQLGRAVIERLKRAPRAQEWQARPFIKELVLSLPPELHEEFYDGWPTEVADWSYWAEYVDTGLAMLQLRRDLWSAIQRSNA